MTGDLNELTRLIPPPTESVAAPPWDRSRAEAGLDFPSDYRAFVDLYGGGYFGAPDSLRFHVYAPTSSPLPRRLETGFRGYIEWHTSEIRPMWEGGDEDHWGGTIYPMYPEPAGLLTWGENETGDMFWWLTEHKDPDEWPVIMWARGPATTYRLGTGMVGLILAMANGGAPSPTTMSSPLRRWTMTSDWLHSNSSVSAGAAEMDHGV